MGMERFCMERSSNGDELKRIEKDVLGAIQKLVSD